MIKTKKEEEFEVSERTKIRESIRLRTEKKKLESFEKHKIECLECSRCNLVQNYESSEFVCNECGLIFDSDLINQGQKWEAFDHA